MDFRGVHGYPEVGFPQRALDNLHHWVEARDEELIGPRMREAAFGLELHEAAMLKCHREVTRMIHVDRRSLTVIILSLVTNLYGEKKVVATARQGTGESPKWILDYTDYSLLPLLMS